MTFPVADIINSSYEAYFAMDMVAYPDYADIHFPHVAEDLPIDGIQRELIVNGELVLLHEISRYY